MRPCVVALFVATIALTVPACASRGGGALGAPPGQVQKTTGYNPASGKFKGEPAAPAKPGNGKSKNQ